MLQKFRSSWALGWRNRWCVGRSKFVWKEPQWNPAMNLPPTHLPNKAVPLPVPLNWGQSNPSKPLMPQQSRVFSPPSDPRIANQTSKLHNTQKTSQPSITNPLTPKMCHRYFAYLECPTCSALHRPIDAVLFCESPSAPPKPHIASADDPSGLGYYTHRGTDHSRSIFSKGWHFVDASLKHASLSKGTRAGSGDHKKGEKTKTTTKPPKHAGKLAPANTFLAFKADTTICDNCLKDNGRYFDYLNPATLPQDSGTNPAWVAQRELLLRRAAEARTQLRLRRDAMWPVEVDAARDTRVFDLEGVKEKMGEPRAIGGVEWTRRFVRHAPGKWVRRVWGRAPVRRTKNRTIRNT